MKPLFVTLLSTVLLAGSSFPAYSDSLLGRVLGGSDDKALVTIGSGDAGKSGVVNLGVGGDQVVDANIGNGRVGSARVGSRDDSGVGADVRLLNNNARVGVGIGGDDGLLDVDIGVGGGGSGGGGNDGGGNGNGGGNGGGLVPGGSVASRGSADPACVGVSNTELERLIGATRFDGSWSRASNVEILRVDVCPQQRNWVAAALTNSGLGPNLQSAIARDALLATSISRSPYGADRVFAVRQNGSQLTVFVY